MNLRLTMRLVVAAALLTMLVPGTTAAATPPAATYHGVFTGTEVVCGTPTTFGGVWNVNLKHDGGGAVDVRISADGRPDAAWGGNYFFKPWSQEAPGDNVFALTNAYALGMSFTLETSGVLSFVITDYCEQIGAGSGDLLVRGLLTH
jgi:hypothetical protein